MFLLFMLDIIQSNCHKMINAEAFVVDLMTSLSIDCMS
jgi:hypothetical protein